MLDDLKLIHERDAQDTLGIAEKQAQQYTHSFNFNWSPPKAVANIVVAGMGGSGLAAKAFKVVANVGVPFEIVQDYELPKYVGQGTLLLCSSYSGNTEETLSALNQALAMAEDRRPMIVVAASGGKLQEIAGAEQLPFLQLPGGYQPRHTFGYQYRALVELFAAADVVQNGIAEVEAAADWLQQQVGAWVPTMPTANNRAKQIALDVIGKSAVIYAGPLLFPAAYKWKISFNENAKHIAWTDTYPEFNHNEMMGWTEQPIDKPYTVIDLRSNLEHQRVQKRMEVTERLLSGRRPAPIVVNAQGDTLLQQLMWTVALGDFVTLYTALANGLNPAPVDLIETFKKALDD